MFKEQSTSFCRNGLHMHASRIDTRSLVRSGVEALHTAPVLCYVTGDPRRPHYEQDEILNNLDWSAFYLWENPEIVPENAARCPVKSPLPMTISRYWKSWARLLPSTTPCRYSED
jgi:hypothetical protein